MDSFQKSWSRFLAYLVEALASLHGSPRENDPIWVRVRNSI
jgi:hypothetical protein